MSLEEKNLAHATKNIEVPEELEELSAWWKKNGNLVSTVVLVVALAVLGKNLWQRHAKDVASKASIAFAQARSVEDLEAAAKSYPSSAEAPVALLRIAGDHYRTGKYDLAAEKYNDFLKKFSRHALAPTAELGLAHVQEAKGEFAAAQAAFDKFAESDAVPAYLQNLALLGKARCLALQGQKDAARTILDRMMADKAGTVWANHADELVSALPRLTFTKSDSAASFSDALLNLASGTAGETTEEAPASEPAPEAPEAPAPEAPAPEPAE